MLALTTKIGANPQGIYHYRQHENQNHKTIKEGVDKVLFQIPQWFVIIDQFYKKYNLYKSHSLHLALFMEHEPYQTRYHSMGLDSNQKEFLFDLIKEFLQKNSIPFLKNEDKKKLSSTFLTFISSANYEDFDSYYKRLKIKYKVKLFLVKFIPISSYRKRMRTETKDEIKLNIY